MSFEARLLVVALGAFAAMSLLVTCVVPLTIRWASRPALPASARARALFLARSAPVVAGLSAAVLASLAFAFYEPRGNEPVGTTLLASAALAVALLAAGTWRCARSLLATHRAMRGWLRSAVPVDLPGISAPVMTVDTRFPVVAVTGLVRSKLVIARSVLDACPPNELVAILAHERYHIEQHDNLKRAALVALPDLLGRLPLSLRLVRDWQEAEEEAADDSAGRLGATGRMDLAQALIRVARLAPPDLKPEPLPASALFRGGSLEHRIRRLAAPPSVASEAPPGRLGTLSALVAAGALSAIEGVHQVVELAVTRLP